MYLGCKSSKKSSDCADFVRHFDCCLVVLTQKLVEFFNTFAELFSNVFNRHAWFKKQLQRSAKHLLLFLNLSFLQGNVAAKSMRNTDRLSLSSLLYSWGRTSTATTFFFNNADKIVRAMRSSSIKYLNTTSYIGLATTISFLYANRLFWCKITKSFWMLDKIFVINFGDNRK